MVKAAAEAVNWEEYFHRIQPVCPWSWSAWRRGLIDITVWRGRVLPLADYEARVYSVNLNRRRLKKLCQQLDDPNSTDEWLWSLPSYGPMATPVPCLIQQDRARLKEIRTSIKNVGSKYYK